MPTLILLLKRSTFIRSVLSTYTACSYRFKFKFCKQTNGTPPHTHSWIAFEQGVHSEDMTSIDDLKRGIDPLFLEFIDDEIERDTTPREILRLIKAKDWNDSVDFPTEIQISNRKSQRSVLGTFFFCPRY